MKKAIYSIKDNVIEQFMAPWLAFNNNDAIRSFKAEINKNENMKNIAKDIELWVLGYYDDETGKIVSDPERIHTGEEAIEI